MSGNAVAQTPYEQLLLEFAPRTIRSQAQYERVLRQIDRLMRKPKLTRAEDDLLELLAQARREALSASHFGAYSPWR